MSFLTQRLANYHPLWTKIRRDPSSFGQRFMSVFAEAIEEQQIANKNLSEEMFLLKQKIGAGHLFVAELDEVDQYRIISGGAGGNYWEYPSITGTIGVDVYNLVRYETYQELFSAAPDRLVSVGSATFSDYIAWDSNSPYVYNAIPYPSRLIISVKNSTVYYKRTAVKNRDKSGRYQVVIKGLDENDIEFTEYIRFDDDGVYWTRNIFKEILDVKYEGFNGDADIKWISKDLDFYPDAWRAGVIDDLEGQLRLRLETRTVGATTYSVLVYEIQRLKRGDAYRVEGVEVIDNVERVSEQTLLDSSGTAFRAVDFAINPRNTKVYVLDDASNVHVFDHGPTAFTPPSVEESSETYIELHPLYHYATFGSTEKIWTYFSRLRYPIGNAVIKRTSPSGLVRYLDASKTWSASSYSFPGKKSVVPEESWDDFFFETTYDELGEYEYQIEVTTGAGVSVYVTKVMVDSVQAESTIATGVPNPDAVCFNKEENLVVVDSVGSTMYFFQEAVDGWVADTGRNLVLLHSEYDSIEVSY